MNAILKTRELYDEAWLPVKGYEGCYEISNKGRVKSLARRIYSPNTNSGYRRINERILKGTTYEVKNHQYKSFNLSKDGDHTCYLVSHLLLHAFIGVAPSHEHCAKFRDGNESNFRLENLYWGKKNRQPTCDMLKKAHMNRVAIVKKCECCGKNFETKYIVPERVKYCGVNCRNKTNRRLRNIIK